MASSFGCKPTCAGCKPARSPGRNGEHGNDRNEGIAHGSRAREGFAKTVGIAYVGSNPTPATTCGNGLLTSMAPAAAPVFDLLIRRALSSQDRRQSKSSRSEE